MWRMLLAFLPRHFRVFNRRLQLHPDNVDCVVKACCVLHIYLSVKKDLPTLYNRLNPDNEPYLQAHGEILDVPKLNGYHSSAQVQAICDVYTAYFNRPEGSVVWQEIPIT